MEKDNYCTFLYSSKVLQNTWQSDTRKECWRGYHGAQPWELSELAGHGHCPQSGFHWSGAPPPTVIYDSSESPLPLRFLGICIHYYWQTRGVEGNTLSPSDSTQTVGWCAVCTHTCTGKNYLLKNVYVYKFFCWLCTVNKLQINHKGARTDKGGGIQTEWLGHGVSLTWKKMCRFINPETVWG